LKQHGKMVLWAANIDRSKSRRQGRRIPKSLSVDLPRLGEIEAAAKSLSLGFISKPGASRPGLWWEKTGCLLVEKGNSTRAEILRSIAKQLAKERPSKKA